MPRHAVITGAAGAIGAAIARALRSQDPRTRLSLVDVDEARIQRAAGDFGDDATAHVWDLSKPETLPDHVRALEDSRGPVDVLVNCAGIMEVRTLAATDWELGDRLMRIDLTSPLRLMSLIAPSMKERRTGAIVNVSSMAGVTPLRGCAYYGAAKAGLAMASEIARLELLPHGVSVITVYPGPVRSDLERRARAQEPDSWLTRWMPTGEAEPLAKLIAEAIVRKRARVVYPSLYDIASRFPGIASRISSVMSPEPLE